MRAPLALAVAAALLATACAAKKPEAPTNPYLERAGLLYAAGVRELARRHWTLAEEAFRQALDAARLADDHAWIARARFGLGAARLRARRWREAAQDFRLAKDEARRAGDARLVERAEAYEALAHARAGKPFSPPEPKAVRTPDARLAWGEALRVAGRCAHARAWFASLGRAEPALLAEARLGEALCAEAAGDTEGARALAREARRHAREAAMPRVVADAAMLLARTGEGREAFENAADAYAIYRLLAMPAGMRAARARIEALAGGGLAGARQWLARHPRKKEERDRP